MNSRTDKYYDENTVGSRTQRNNQLYRDINQTELDSFELKSNATVIGNNKGNNINVEKIKSILDTHYNDVPKRRSIKLEEPEEIELPRPAQETKEYDINVILDKAKGEKIEDYKEDRSKKLRDTQFDILNNLNIDPKDYIEDYEEDVPKDDSKDKTGAADDLQKLIDTIALNENDIKKERIKIEETVSIKEVPEATKETPVIEEDDEDGSPLDIFEELKGGEDTTVLEGLQEKTEKMIEEIQNTTNISPAVKESATTSLDNTFFTKTNSFKKEDFEEYEDFSDVEKPTSIFVKLIIVILVLIFIAGVVILVKQFI